MIKIYFSTIIVAMVSLLTFTSCDKPASLPSSVSPGEITLSVIDITANSAVVKTEPANALGTYYVNVISMAQYNELGSDNALILKDMTYLAKQASTYGKTFADYLKVILSAGNKTLLAPLASPSTGYYAYAYGLDADGKATTDVVKKIFVSTNTPAKFIDGAVEYGIYNDVKPFYIYNIDKHQTATTKKPYRFVMQSDDQTQYMVATTSSLPDTLKATVDVAIIAVGVNGFKDGVRKMELVKTSEEKAWLWSQDESLGIVVAVPIY